MCVEQLIDRFSQLMYSQN